MTPRRRSHRDGFTIVELMMSLAVLAVGVSGIFAMQKVTAMTNLHSKSVATATRIAQAWQNQLLVDGSLWQRSTGLTNTFWLSNVSTTTTWFRPSYDSSREFGAGFDALGNPVTDANIAQAQFCVHLMMVPIVALTDTTNATIRVTVRVLWPRVQGDPGSSHFCSTAVTASTIGNDTLNFHSLYQTTAIRIHP